MASEAAIERGRVLSRGRGRRVLGGFATGLVTTVVLVAAAPAAALDAGPDPFDGRPVAVAAVAPGTGPVDDPPPAPDAAAPTASGGRESVLDGREIGVPLALLAGIGIFLLASSQAGPRASKLTDAPLRPLGALPFPESQP